MSIFADIVETVVNEIKYHEFKRKQASITRLFPTFFQRVEDVARSGGIKRMQIADPDTWMFDVASASGESDYAIWLHFTNIPQVLEKWVPVKSLWNTDRKSVNYLKLAQEVLNDVDMQTDCDCAADTFWGSEYIKTQKNAQYGNDQRKAPDVRNPKQYGILCKHAQLVWRQLPMWTSTFAKFLKEFWKDEVENIVKRILDSEKPAEAPKAKGTKQVGPAAGETPVAGEEEGAV